MVYEAEKELPGKKESVLEVGKEGKETTIWEGRNGKSREWYSLSPRSHRGVFCNFQGEVIGIDD